MIDKLLFYGHKNVKNQSLKWFPMDTEKLYLQNLSKFNSENNWKDVDISYDFNSYGFRCDEFTSDNNIVFLGCSNTLGVGLPLENTFAYNVSKSLNLKMCNLGKGGGALDTCFRLAYYWLNILQPKIVVCQMPEETRLELRDTLKEVEEAGDPWKTELLVSYTHKFYRKHWLRFPEQYILHQHKNLLAIKSLCQQLNIKLVVLDQSIFRDIKDSERDFARDLAHYGRKTHKQLANIVLGKINEQEY